MRSFFSRATATRICSPGRTKGVMTTRPSWRLRPAPPWMTFSTLRVSSAAAGDLFTPSIVAQGARRLVDWKIAMKKRVFSGIQPTGNVHIGNYLGALRNWVTMQHDYESIFCIVDLHAITVYQDPAELRQKIVQLAGLFIAAGIDPSETAIIVQSSVAAHAELAWMLTCVTPLGWLERMTQFKAKTEAMETIGDGLLQYPVLMAADILLYQAAIVPVGDDQKQHLELARDIAQRFNSLYGDTFVMPETRLPMVGARIMGLDDPTKKMSKSAPGSGHAIGLLDDPKEIRKKIMRATTDSNPGVDFENLGDGVANLLSIFRAFTDWSEDAVRQHFAGMRYGDLKKTVAEAVVAGIEPIQKRYAEITADPGYVSGELQKGAERVRPIADETAKLVRERMGLYNVG
jgi:tryptophanyl-tRNA synthetase